MTDRRKPPAGPSIETGRLRPPPGKDHGQASAQPRRPPETGEDRTARPPRPPAGSGGPKKP